MRLFIILFVGLIHQAAFAQTYTPELYIEQYASIAQKEMELFKIPASITLAQGILESASGGSLLAIQANNHFGVKCGSNWKGETFKKDDDKKSECFRKYKNAEASFKDHSKFIANSTRYAFLFEYNILDYKAWAKGLKKAGYATNPKYPSLLIDLIERYDLSRFDRGERVVKRAPEKMSTSSDTQRKTKKKKEKKLKSTSKVYHDVKKGETLYSLAKQYNTTVAALKKANNKRTETLNIGDRLLIP